MRTLSAPLIAAQKAATGTPYVAVTLANGKGGASTTYASNDAVRKLISVKHTEQPYQGWALIVISNYDKTIVANYLGYYVTINYGYNITGTPTVPTEGGPSPLWVKSQFQLSKEGNCDIVLYCTDSWTMLSERNDIGSLLGGVSPFYIVDYPKDTTIYDVIDAVLAAVSMDLVALGSHDDSIIDTLMPEFGVNSVPFDSPYSLMYRLLNMTKCFLRAERCAGAELAQFRVIYTTVWSDYHATYTSDQTGSNYQFKDYEWRDSLLYPTRVYVAANRVDTAEGFWDTLQIITGDSDNVSPVTPEGGYIETVQYHVAETLAVQGDADKRAYAIMLRQWMEQELGRIVVQHDCGLELYDWVNIRDKRGAAAYTDYPTTKWGKNCVVGSLVHTFGPGVYELEITLNGIDSSMPVDSTVRPAKEKVNYGFIGGVGAGGPLPGQNAPAPEGTPFKPILDPARYGGSPAAWNVMLDLATGGAKVRRDITVQAIQWAQKVAPQYQKPPGYDEWLASISQAPTPLGNTKPPTPTTDPSKLLGTATGSPSTNNSNWAARRPGESLWRWLMRSKR